MITPAVSGLRIPGMIPENQEQRQDMNLHGLLARDSSLVRTYYRMPVTLQHAVCSAYGWQERRTRFNDTFDEKLAWLHDTDLWSRSQIRQYQDEQVARLIEHAYRHVEYYRSEMDKRGLRPRDITSVDDLQKLPIMTKDDLRANFSRLISDSAQRENLIEHQTSGSTGSPLITLKAADAIAFQWAVWWRHRHRFGVNPGDLHANFSSRPVVPINQEKPPYWRWNWPFKQALVPLQQIVPKKIHIIHEFLEKQPFEFHSGYPSSMHTLAMYASDAGLTLNRGPKAVFAGAEGFRSFQREAIERYTRAPATQQYGFSEGAANASECDHLRYHEDFEFGVMECIDPVTDPRTGEVTGSIVATGFSNPAFPLIRYRVGDSATWYPSDRMCECGRESQVIASIDGRSEEYVTTPEGGRVTRFDQVFKDKAYLRQAQIRQSDPESIIVRIVPADTFSPADEDDLRSTIAAWISPGLKVSIDQVSSIPLGPNGKFQAVVRSNDR